MTGVVLDTNVWVSALLFPGGTCDELLQALERRRTRLFTSEAMLDELRDVLKRKFDYPTAEADAVARTIRLKAHVVHPDTRVQIIRRDDADNRVLECALAAQAELIVSGDTRDLLPLGAFRGIPIQSPRSALNQWKR